MANSPPPPPPPPQAPFRPALIIVDFQNDFCPPTGALAVPDGRAIASPINTLLTSPRLVARIASQDWHPQDHISFAASHTSTSSSSANKYVPFTSTIDLANPLNPTEVQRAVRLWPVHCVAGSPGAELVRELDVARLTGVVRKGTDARVEMYSAFRDEFREPQVVCEERMAGMLRAAGATHVYVVGLAMDYCVKCTAIDAAGDGYVTCVVREGTRAVDEHAIPKVEAELRQAGVAVVSMEDDEVRRLFS